MAAPTSNEGFDARTTKPSRLDRPLADWWCAIGWLTASVVFVALTTWLGGPTSSDSGVSTFPTWAIAHGQVACAYPPAGTPGLNDIKPFIAPLYPLLAAALAATFDVGDTVAFPSPRRLGEHCHHAVAAISRWSVRTGAVDPTLRFGYLGWLALLAGAIALLRSVGLGRRLREPLVLVALAVTPPVVMCVQSLFHPQDLLALGLILGGLAFARRSQWWWAGVLIGLAFTAQQFALLAMIPLAVVAPKSGRPRFALGAAVAATLMVVPIAMMSSGRALRAALVGSGLTLPDPGTLMWELHLRAPSALLVARLGSVVAGAVVALWSSRRLREAALEPVALVSLIATALALRLVFEANLFGYYPMAVSVMMVLLVAMGERRLLLPLVGWLAVVTLAYDPLPWGVHPLFRTVPYWVWQVVIVPSGLLLVAAPLVARVRDSSHRPTATSSSGDGLSPSSPLPEPGSPGTG